MNYTNTYAFPILPSAEPGEVLNKTVTSSVVAVRFTMRKITSSVSGTVYDAGSNSTTTTAETD